MVKLVPKNVDTNTEATLTSAIALNATTSTTILAADTGLVSSKRKIFISNPTNKDVWVKLQAASADNDKKGIWLPKNSVLPLPGGEIYTGEISAISVSGTPSVYLTTY